MAIFDPDVAKQTLLAVCEKDNNGNICIQLDNQGWDKIVWAIGAWQYYLSSGDLEFLQTAVSVIKTALQVLKEQAFNAAYGLFTGGSFFNDDISGYPLEIHDNSVSSSFVGDHILSKSIMCLSTNCLYAAAYRILQQASKILGDKETEQCAGANFAAMRKSINTQFWNENSDHYDYIIFSDGRHNTAQEACGNLFAVLFNIAPEDRHASIIKNLKCEQFGLTSILPPFEEFSKEMPGRHNNIIWPFINAFYIIAAAQNGLSDLSESEWKKLTTILAWSDYCYFEIYNPYDGRPDGGWQSGMHWYTGCDQTWSATGYIATILYGVFGISLQEEGLILKPCVPEMFENAKLDALVIRNRKLNLHLKGYGNCIKEIEINGRRTNQTYIHWGDLKEENQITIYLQVYNIN